MQTDTLVISQTFDLSVRKIPVFTFTGHQPGPVIWLTAGCHGDEVIPIVVLHRLMDMLHDGLLSRGTLHIMPAMNPLSAEMGQRANPLDGENLNRCYPGDADGSLSERMADTIYQRIVVSQPDLVIDLHTIAFRSVPFIILDRFLHTDDNPELAQQLFNLAALYGVPVVYDFPLPVYKKRKLHCSLPGALLNHAHIPAYTVELGPKHIVDEPCVETGLRGLLNTLASFDMVVQSHLTTLPTISTDTAIPHLRRDDPLRASTSGVLHPVVQPGERVHAGQELAQIRALDGTLQECITADKDGLLLVIQDVSVLVPGMEVMTIAVSDT